MSIIFSNNSSHLTIQGNTKAIIKASINIVGTNTNLPIEIVGEFKDIPQHLHQMYMQTMMNSYGSTTVYANTKEEEDPYPMTIEEQQKEWRWNRLTKLICKAIGK
jgi:hypothetical protein